MLEGLQRGLRAIVRGEVSLAIVGMQEIGPGVPEHFLRFDAEELEIGLIHVLHTVDAAHPDERRRAVHQRAEARLAAAQRGLRFLALPDVLDDAHGERRLPVPIRHAKAMQLHPQRRAVFPDVALLLPHRRHEPAPDAFERFHVGSDVVGMRDVLRRQHQQRVARPAHELHELVVHALEAAVEIGLEDAQRRAVVHDPQPLSTHPE